VQRVRRHSRLSRGSRLPAELQKRGGREMANLADVKALANRLAEETDSDVFLLSAGIDRPFDRTVISLVQSRSKKRNNVILLLTTEGGDADAGFRIARCFQESYDSLTIVVAGWCKSAGTLICIAANRLVLGPHAELGPLDVQLIKPDDLGDRASGLTIDSAFRSLQEAAFTMFERFFLSIIERSGGRITTRTAADMASNITVGLISPIFAQIDPNKVGDDYRATQIAEQYAIRLDLIGRNLVSTEDFEAVEALVRGYPSHGFVIDRSEAQNLFKRVEEPQGALLELLDALGDACIVPRSTPRGDNPIMNFLNEEASHGQKDAGDGQDNEATAATGTEAD
jgi:hypothetical protein